MRFSQRIHLVERGSRSRHSPVRFDPVREALRPQLASSAGKRRRRNGNAGKTGRNAGKSPLKKKSKPSILHTEKVSEASVAVVDKELATVNVTVFKNGTIESDEKGNVFAAQLALVNPAVNSDKYYILQLIGVGDKKYVYRRFGRTGTVGQNSLEGPMDTDKAVTMFTKLFKSKTGQNWDSRSAEDKPTSLKFYTYLNTNWHARSKESAAVWKYHLVNDPLGKPDGWYEYDEKAGAEVEELYQKFVVDSNASMAVRCVFAESSGFTYRVDLTQLTQTNTTSSKTRPIQRICA